MVKELNEKNFDKKIEKGKVLVDFFATWCGPCRMLSPVVDELSKEVKDYEFYKVDVDENEDLAARFGIMTIPTLLIFKDGELKKTNVGLISKNDLLEMLKEE